MAVKKIRPNRAEQLKNEYYRRILNELNISTGPLWEKEMREDVAKCFNKECCPDCPRECAKSNDCFLGGKEEVKSEAEKLADKHWEYVGSVLELQYKTAFIHGYKHGREAKEEPVKEWAAESFEQMYPKAEMEKDGYLTIYETSTGRFLTDEKTMED